MTSLFYSRMLVAWITLGLVLLNGYLLYRVLSIPFEPYFLFLGWLVLGLDVVLLFVLSILWNTDMEI